MKKVTTTRQTGIKNLTIKKHSATIHISCALTTFQRKLWNVLFGWAIKTKGDSFVQEEYHEITFSELATFMQYNSNDTVFIHESLNALTTSAIQWNLLGKDKLNDWDFVGKGAVGLLSFWEAEGGRIRYSYHPALRERLVKPNMFAKINLKFLQNFESRYSVVLYELLVDYWNAARSCSETPFIEVEKLRYLMGLLNNEHAEWKYFSDEVLKPAIQEIEAKTPFRIELRKLKEQRKIVAIKFVCTNVSYSESQELLFPNNSQASSLFKPQPAFTFRTIPVKAFYRLAGQEIVFEKVSETEARKAGQGQAFTMQNLDVEVQSVADMRK